MDSDIATLIKLTKGGDKDAFGKIYKIFLKRIYRFLYYLSSYNRELAEDLSQLTFLKAWQKISSFDAKRGTFQAFVFAIARNLLIDYQRKKKTVALEKAENVASLTDDPTAEAEANEQKEQIRKLLSRLDSNEKQLVIWRYFEELSFSEIAHILKEKEGAVRVRLHRILKKLKEENQI